MNNIPIIFIHHTYIRTYVNVIQYLTLQLDYNYREFNAIGITDNNLPIYIYVLYIYTYIYIGIAVDSCH